jgi:mono/diheme cytochrome c family protein
MIRLACIALLSLLVLISLGLGGCGQNMTDQPKYGQYQPATLFPNGRVLQAPVAGTVARGDLERAETAREKPPLTAELLARGREQFDIFCSPCHDRTGSGQGMVVQRGMPRPPSYDIARLRTAQDQHFFDVISNGYGAMYSYASRVPPRDRWAIVAYIRALQLSQDAALDDVPDEERERLLAQGRR